MNRPCYRIPIPAFITAVLLWSGHIPALKAQIVYEKDLPRQPPEFNDHGQLVREAFAGNPEAQFWHGVNYQDSGSPDIAAKWLEAAVAKGHAAAMHNLGRLYQNGNGVPKDAERAYQLYLRSAEKGLAHAQYDVALCYDEGWGVLRDLKEADRWCKLAEEAGYGYASEMRAWWYRFGKGYIAKDRVKAGQLYRIAAKQGQFHAAHQLAWMYLDGEGIKQDFQRAEKWFRVGAYSGDPLCIKDLAMFLAGCPDAGIRNGDEAAALIREAMEAVKPNMNFKYPAVYGYALTQCGRFEEARAQFDIAMEINQVDATKSVEERESIASSMRRDKDFAERRIPYVMTLAYSSAFNPVIPDDDIMENSHWPQLRLKKSPPVFDSQGWMERLRAALVEIPALKDKPTIFDLAAATEFGFFSNAPSLPSRRVDVDALLKRTEAGDSLAAYTLSALLLSDPAEKSKQDLGLALLQRLAEIQQPDACHLLGWLHVWTRWVPQDKTKALELFLVAANQLDPDGQHSAAHAYDNGFKGSADLIQAVRWYRRAAYKHQIGAQYTLAHHLLIGRGASKNVVEAIGLLNKAVARDYAPAQMLLGTLYESGNDLPQDRAKAFTLYAKAADKGYADALHQMGLLLMEGIDVKKSPRQAAEKFLEAAKKRHLGSARNLGDCYYSGIGVPLDYPRAEAWLRLCTISGQPYDMARMAVFYGSCPDAKHRQPEQAVKFASAALQELTTDNCPEGPRILQAAAIAHASDGEYFKAVEYERRAGKALRSFTVKNDQLAKAYIAESDQRLKLYLNHQPFIATAPKPDPSAKPLADDPVLDAFESLSKPKNSSP